MRKLETYGTIKNGKLSISYRNKFMQAIPGFGDCRVRLKLEKLYKQRSTKTYRDDGSEGYGQNGYYWKIIVPEFCEGWQDLTGEQIKSKEAHEKLKMYCNYKEIVNYETGEVLTLGLSTATLSTVEFDDFCDRCRKFIFEWMGKNIPLPNEQAELELTV